MIAAVLASSLLWLTPGQAAHRIITDEDPGRITATECYGYGVHHGRRYRRFECAAAGPHGCLYYFRLKVVGRTLYYSDQDQWCAGRD